MTKQEALYTVFGVYVGVIPLFAGAYFALYRRQRSNFVFAADIYSTRLSDEKLQADEQITWFNLLIDYFRQFNASRSSVVVKKDSDHSATFQLPDGRSIVLEQHYQHAPRGGKSEWAPQVRLLRADGTLDREERLIGHGFLSEFDNWGDYLSAAAEPLRIDLNRAQTRRVELDTSQPSIWRYLDFVYFSTITQSTIGYGDILPNSTAVRSIVLSQIIFAYALLIVVLNLVLST